MTTDSISPAELAAIRDTAFKAEVLKHQAATAAKDVELAQLRTFLRHGLSEADTIDLNTGAIQRVPLTPVGHDDAMPDLEEPKPKTRSLHPR